MRNHRSSQRRQPTYHHPPPTPPCPRRASLSQRSLGGPSEHASWRCYEQLTHAVLHVLQWADKWLVWLYVHAGIPSPRNGRSSQTHSRRVFTNGQFSQTVLRECSKWCLAFKTFNTLKQFSSIPLTHVLRILSPFLLIFNLLLGVFKPFTALKLKIVCFLDL